MAASIVLNEPKVKTGFDRWQFVADFRDQVAEMMRAVVTFAINAALRQEVDALLKREPYARRGTGADEDVVAYCLKCRSRRRGDFRRNGHKKRQLVVSSVGVIDIWMPRLECARCQGTVHMSYQTVKPRQRLWDDVDEEMWQSHGRGSSLREIAATLSERWASPVGLRSINDRVHRVAKLAGRWQRREWRSCPPVVMLDAIWITILQATGEVQLDLLGRQRPVKKGERRPLLVALGVWPEEGRKVILGWELGDGPGEDGESWLQVLTRLEGQGIQGRNGLRLIVHDGGSGLRQALDEVYFGAPCQRCVFHKLRNIGRAIIVPEEMDRAQAKRLKCRILRQASAIWQGKRQDTARRRLMAFSERWAESQPKVVATAQRDFEDTIAFYKVLEDAKHRGQDWAVTLLRTTSLLERINRIYRRRIRLAVAIHSLTGLEAMLTQQAARIETPYHWPRHLTSLMAQAP